MRKTWLALLMALMALTLVLAACGTEADDVAEQADDGAQEAEEPEDTPEPEEPDAADETDQADETDEAETADDATVMLADTDLGEVIVDGEGMTLYLFEPDDAGESTCYDDCAANWPPLTQDDPVAGDGVDGGMLGTVERDDGSMQVTYNGWPLYYWAGDDAPGDVAGQGVQDVWWVVDADGTAVQDAPDEDDGSGGGGGAYSY